MHLLEVGNTLVLTDTDHDVIGQLHVDARNEIRAGSHHLLVAIIINI